MGQSRGVLTSCDTGAPVRPVATVGTANKQDQPRNHSADKTMKVTIGSKTFTATLDDTPAVIRTPTRA